MVSMFIFTLGFGIIAPIMSYVIKDMGATAFDLGLLLATSSAMQFVFAPVWGRLSDRFGRKPVLLAGLCGFGISFVIVGLSTELWMLYVSQVISGVLSAGIWPAALAYVADIAPQKERGHLIGLLGAASGMGMIIGPVGSCLMATISLQLPFFAAAALAFATMPFVVILLPESRKPGSCTGRHEKMSMFATIKTPFGGLLLLMLFISFAIACIDGTMAFFIMDRFGLTDVPSSMPLFGGNVTITGPQVVGVIFIFAGLTGIVCQALLAGMAIRRFGEEKVVIAGLLLLAAGLLLLQLTTGLASLTFYICLMILGGCLINTGINTLVSNRTDDDHQGEAMGMLGAFNSLGRVLGPAAGGFAYVISMSLPYVSSAAISCLTAAALSLKSKMKTRVVI
jgi:multidrug resistance protein